MIILCYVMYVFVQSVRFVQNRCGLGMCIVSCLYLYMQSVWYMCSICAKEVACVFCICGVTLGRVLYMKCVSVVCVWWFL